MAIAYHTHTFSVPTADAADLLAGTEGGKVITPDVLGPVTAAGKALLSAANAGAQRAALDLEPGTDVQAYDADLAALAGLTSAANKIPYFTGSATAGLLDFKDEDTMLSDSATAVPSQQSVKAAINTFRAETVAAASALNLSGWAFVKTNRYSSASPPCETLWKQRATDPGHAGAWQDSVGTWFEYVPGERGVNALAMGCVGNSFGGIRGGISAADQTFVDANARFTSANVGATIVVGGAGAAGVNLTTTIASVTSATTVELTDAASTTVSGAEWFCYTADDTTAAQRAASVSIALKVPAYFPAGGYYITATIHDGFGNATPDDFAIVGDGARTIFWHGGNTNLVRVYGGGIVATGSSPTLSAPNDAMDQTSTITDTTSLFAGQWVHIIDTSATDDHPMVTESWVRGEINRVKSITDGTTVVWETPLERAYTTGTYVQAYINQTERPTFKGFRIYSAVPSGAGSSQIGIASFYSAQLKIDDVSVYGLDSHGVYLDHSQDFVIRDGEIDRLRNEDGANPYSIRVGWGCCNGVIEGLTGRRGRHLVTSIGSASYAGPDHIRVVNCNATAFDLAGLDTHAGGRFWTFVNPHVNAGAIPGSSSSGVGMQVRGWGTTVINPVVHNASVGIMIIRAMHARVIGGRAVNCLVGAQRSYSPGSGFDGTVVENPVTTGFLIDDDAYTGMTGGFVKRTQVIGNPSGYAYDFQNWFADEDTTFADLKAFDATSQYNGIPHATLYGGMTPSAVKKSNFKLTHVEDGSLGILTSGQLSLTAIELEKGLRITTLSHIGGAAAVDQTNFWLAIYDKDRNRLGVTSDDTTTTTTGLRTLSLATPFTTEYSGLYYIGILCVATTSTQGCRGFTGSATAMAGPPIMNGNSSSTGLTNPASAPSTAGAITAGASIPWVGVG